ncbi:MAG: energy transducer TonB [Saprospiraceae bacterium]
MKTLFFTAAMSLLLSLTVKSQDYFGFKEYAWIESNTCKQCHPCRDQASDKTEVQKKIAFYCNQTLVEAWTLHKISLPACDSTQILITNQLGDRREFVNEDEALKAMCANAYQSCPGAAPGLLPLFRGEYSARLISYIEAETSNSPRQDDTTNQANPPSFFQSKEIDIMPRFPGCEDLDGSDAIKKACADRKMLEFIYSRIKYPLKARQNGVEGMVVLTFIVEKDGTMSNITLLRDIGAGCGEESLRVVKLMNKEKIKWTPGMREGQPVRVQFNLPIKYKLG